jgi:hypothetical protein
MQGITVEQVRAADVADLAASLLGLPDSELLAEDAESAEATVAAAQRVISAITAVQAVAIEAWGRREGEQLRIDKVEWAAVALTVGTNPRGINAARQRLQDGVPKDEHDFMPSYLAPGLRLSPRSAGRRYETARTLVQLLPTTLAAMRAGDLEPHRAQQIVDEVPTDNPVVCGLVEAVLFPKIVDKASTRVGQLARKAVAAADPSAVAQKAEEVLEARFVFAGPSGLPGLMRFEAEVDAGKGRLVWAAIEELAATYLKEDVAATMGQARADALVDLVLANVSVSTVVDLALPAGFATGALAPAGSCPSCGRGSASGDDQIAGGGVPAAHRAGGSVLEDHSTGVLVDADQDVEDPNMARLLRGLPSVGVLDHRVGTQTSETIKAILADPDTVFRRLVIDPDTGWLLDSGATTYHPGRHLAKTIRKRDVLCRFPGCATAARFCDLDHVIPFPVGSTVLRNLACLCRRHHRLKTHGHWSLAMSPDGVCTWVDRRTGQIHTTEPVDYRDLAV